MLMDVLLSIQMNNCLVPTYFQKYILVSNFEEVMPLRGTPLDAYIFIIGPGLWVKNYLLNAI